MVSAARPVGPSAATILAIVTISALVAFAPITYAVGLLSAAGVVIAVLARPAVGFALLAFAVPFGSVIDSRLGSLPAGTADAVALLAIASWLIKCLVRRQAIRTGPFFWPLLALVGAVTLSASFALDPATSAKEMLRWVELLLVYLGVVNVAATGRSRSILVGAVFVAVSAEALLGAVQFFGQIGPPAFQAGRFLRSYGTFGQPNPYGGYLVLTLPLALAVVLFWKPGGRSWFWRLAVATSIAATIALVMSLSRGAWLGLAVAGLVGAALYSRRAAIVSAALAALAILAISLQSLSLLPAVIGQRIASTAGYFRVFDARGVYPSPDIWAIVERMAHWQAGWEMLLDHPLVGVGPGHYPIAYPDYAILPYWTDALGHAHNIYLNIGAEMGMVGLVSYLVCLASWLVIGFRRARRDGFGTNGTLNLALAVGILGCLIGAGVHNFFDNLYVHAMNIHVGVLIGILGGLGAFPDSDEPASDSKVAQAPPAIQESLLL